MRTTITIHDANSKHTFNSWYYNFLKLSKLKTHSILGKLSDNSDDVANLIKDQLESIVSSTQLNPQAPPGVTVTVIPKCAGAQVRWRLERRAR